MRMKNWLITAAVLVLAGCLIFGGVMTVLQWDFTALSTGKFVTNEHKVTTDFKNISIAADTADIVFVPTQGAVSVVCYEREKEPHTVTVADGTLTIKLTDMRKWYEHIGITFSTPKITVNLPAGAYEALSIQASTGDVHIPQDFAFVSTDIALSTGDVKSLASALGVAKITASTGDIRVENTAADALTLTVSTGDVSLSHVTCAGDITIGVSTGKTAMENVKCTTFTSVGDTGDIALAGVLAAGKLSIERSTGDVHFDGCDAAEIFVKTDTGHVRGCLLSPKLFVAKSDTGRVDVPDSVAAGRCEVTTDTGNIRLTVEP